MSDRGIIEAIQKLTGTVLTDKVYIVSCEVKSVDESKRSCVCTIVEGNIQNEITAKLMPVVDDGLLLVPSISSIVKIILSDYNEPSVYQYSQVDKIILVVGDSTLEIIDGLFKFNDGTLKGMVKLDSIVQRLNNIEDAYNDLVSKFNSHTHILTLSSGTGTAAPTVTTEGTTLIKTEANDLENTKIKQ